MGTPIDIWLVGNTGLRNPNRIKDGFSVFAESSFVGNLRGRENDIAFMNLLNEKGIIQNEGGKDESGSHARKWRLMFSKNGLIYPKLDKKYGEQAALGKMDDITPFGRVFLKADTYPAVQECFLRAMSVEQFPLAGESSYFSPLRWILAIMLELEKRTGSSELSRIEFALWGHTTNPKYSLSEVVDNILDLRMRRAKAPAKKTFDRQEIAVRAKDYDKKSDNFLDYSDMNIKSAALKKCRNVWMPQLLAITNWAIQSRQQKRAWPRLPCCGRTSSITPGHVRSMMPTAKPGTVRAFWMPIGKKSPCTRLQKPLLMKLD